MGVKDVILCDTKGIIYEDRTIGMNTFKEEMTRITNKAQKYGTLSDALVGADISAPGVFTKEVVCSMRIQLFFPWPIPFRRFCL